MNQLNSQIQIVIQQTEIARLKKKITTSENQWKKQKAILLQKIQIQQLKFQQLLQRQQTQKKFYQNILKSYNIVDDFTKKRNIQVQSLNKQIQQLHQKNKHLVCKINQLNQQLQKQKREKIQLQDAYNAKCNTLNLKIQESEAQITFLNNIIQSERRKTKISKQRQQIQLKQPDFFKSHHFDSEGYLNTSKQKQNTLLCFNSILEEKQSIIQELGLLKNNNKQQANKQSHLLQIKSENKRICLENEYSKSLKHFEYLKLNHNKLQNQTAKNKYSTLKSGTIMNVKDIPIKKFYNC